MVSLVSIISQIHCQANPKIRVYHTEKSKANNVYKSVKIRILDGGNLCISKYSFEYNGEGGRGTGSRLNCKDDNEQLDSQAPVRFKVDLKTVHIPPMTSATTTLGGWAPFPPFVKVDVVPEIMEGNIHKQHGKIELKLKAKLCVSIGSTYKAPPLLLDTILTSEESNGAIIKSRRGMRLSKDGKCKLVGVTSIDRVEDHYINSILTLPCECFTSLNVIISFF